MNTGYYLHGNLKKNNKLVNETKKKLTHIYREQNSRLPVWAEGRGRGNAEVKEQKIQTIKYKISYKDILYKVAIIKYPIFYSNYEWDINCVKNCVTILYTCNIIILHIQYTSI